MKCVAVWEVRGDEGCSVRGAWQVWEVEGDEGWSG